MVEDANIIKSASVPPVLFDALTLPPSPPAHLLAFARIAVLRTPDHTRLSARPQAEDEVPSDEQPADDSYVTDFIPAATASSSYRRPSTIGYSSSGDGSSTTDVCIPAAAGAGGAVANFSRDTAGTGATAAMRIASRSGSTRSEGAQKPGFFARPLRASASTTACRSYVGGVCNHVHGSSGDRLAADGRDYGRPDPISPSGIRAILKGFSLLPWQMREPWDRKTAAFPLRKGSSSVTTPPTSASANSMGLGGDFQGADAETPTR